MTAMTGDNGGGGGVIYSHLNKVAKYLSWVRVKYEGIQFPLGRWNYQPKLKCFLYKSLIFKLSVIQYIFLANATYDYQRLKIRIVCVGNFEPFIIFN